MDLWKRQSDPSPREEAERLLERGLSSLRNGDYADALSHFDAVVALDPGYYEAWKGKGEAYLQLHEFERSAGSFEQAFTIRKGDEATKQAYAFSLLSLGKIDDALRALDLKIHPDALYDLISLVKTLLSIERNTDALYLLERTLSIDPGDAYSWCLRGVILSRIAHSAPGSLQVKRSIPIKRRRFSGISDQQFVPSIKPLR